MTFSFKLEKLQAETRQAGKASQIAASRNAPSWKSYKPKSAKLEKLQAKKRQAEKATSQKAPS